MDELHERFAAQPEAAQAARLRIDQACERAKSMVAERRRMIEAVAGALLDQYVLTADQIGSILAACASDCASRADAAAGTDGTNDNGMNNVETKNDAMNGARAGVAFLSNESG